jgi:hypothetical protein
MTPPDPEAAWRELDAAERAFPDCEHVRAWQQRVADARGKHRAALAAVDEAAAREAEPVPVPSSLPSEPEPDDDGALFPLEAA